MAALRWPMRLLAGLAMVAGVVGHARDELGKLFEKAAGPAPTGIDPAAGRPAGCRSSRVPGRHDASTPEPHVIKNATAGRWSPYATAADRSPPGAMPVILCHGLTYNALFWDLDPSCSFPGTFRPGLRRLGCQPARLRDEPEVGLEASRRLAGPRSIGLAERRLTKARSRPTVRLVDPRYANWTLDDHIAYDVPALVHLVRRRTGCAGGRLGRALDGGHHRDLPPRSLRQPRHRPARHRRQPGDHAPGAAPVEFCARRSMPAEAAHRPAPLSGAGRPVDRTGIHNMFFNVQNVTPSLRGPLGRPGDRHPRHRPDGAVQVLADEGRPPRRAAAVQLR